MTEVAKPGSLMTSLQSIKKTTALAGKAQEELTSGRKVNNIKDNPLAFLMAKELMGKASSLSDMKVGIDQAVSSVETASIGMDAIEDFAKQMKGLVESARSASPAEQRALAEQFEELGNQISQVAQDASYNGQNLLSGNNQVEARFSERSESKLSIEGFNLNGPGVDSQNGLFSVAAYQTDGSFSISAFGVSGNSFTSIGTDQAAFSDISQSIDKAVSRIRGQSAALGSNVALLQERMNYTDSQVNNLISGSDKLTLTDLNEASANFMAANTGQKIGMAAISIAGDQARSIVQLMGQG